MNYELAMTRTSVRLYERVGFTRCMDFPNNYALRIMNYELIMTRTSVRLYEGWIHQMRGFSQQLCITHYEL